MPLVPLLAACTAPSERPPSGPPPEPTPTVDSTAPELPAIAVRINEVMPGNRSTVDGPDPAARADWIELVNPGTEPVPLERVFLQSDDPDASIWQGPAGVELAPGGRRVVWAGAVDDEPLATGWRLDRDGGSLTVLDDAGAALDAVQWGQVPTDVSLARFPDLTGEPALTAWPTPGAPNGDGPSPTLDAADATVFLPFVMHRIDFGFRGDARANIDKPSRPEVRVTMAIDGVTFPDVGLSLKGSASYDTMDRKPAFNVDVNAFDPEGSYRGLDGFKLHNGNVLDPTRDRDYLTYQLARQVGLFAPRIGWAEVYCDDDYYGLYILVEDHDDEMIEYYFPGQKDLGVVLEPNEDSSGQFLFADFGTGKLDDSDYEEGPVPPDPNVILALKRADAIVSEPPTDENLAAFFEDVAEDEFLSYLAWEAVVAHTDGYKAVNNWRLYVDGTTRVIQLVPSGAEWTWDADADLWSSGGNAAQWCFDNPACARSYAERVLEVADTADALGLYDQFLALQDWLDPYIRTDPRYPHTDDVGSARNSTASRLVDNPQMARSQVYQRFPDLE